MTKNKDRWSALSMQERADLINMYLKSGVSNLSEIKKHYNSYEDGGETDDNESFSFKGRGFLKNLAYKFGSDAQVSGKGYASIEDIKRILSPDYEPDITLDDNKLMYIYGNINGLYPAESTNGKDYSEYIRRVYPRKAKDIKEYIGTINPYGEYLIDERDRGLVEELARKGKGLYSNADTEYSFMADMFDPEIQPYRDDVSSYHAQFVRTPEGYAISASDIYDFGPDYNPLKYSRDVDSDLLARVESALMGFVGNPYILRQDNVPIRFVDTSDDTDFESTMRAIGFREGIGRAMLSPEDRANGVSLDEKIAQVLETGYIEPATVTAERKLGGKINRFDDGGDTKATLVGKVGFNPFKAFNRNYRGTNIYESDNFGDAFRQARIDGEDMFVWNDNVYSTKLKPNEFVEAAKAWDTQGDLAKEDFRMSIIRNPQGVLDYYNSTYPKGKYTTANRRINEYDIPYMYSLGTKGMEDLVMNKYANQAIGDAIWKELANSKLSYEQKIAILANSYHETNGWTALRQYGNGPASGIYMMEKPQREVYKAWLADNNLKDSYANQTKFVVSLFDNKDSSLRTAWDRAGDMQEEIKSYKDSNEAESKGYRAAYNHQDYTTQQAFKDWNSSDLDATTTAFEGLFERAGVPALENRMRIAHILSKKYK